MVMACDFSGEGAEKQAHELVVELRKRYKLPAYSYLGHFDPGKAEVLGFNKYGKKPRAAYYKYREGKNPEHPDLVEVAVLVGNYRAADDPKAQSVLHTLKYAKPKCLELKDGKQTQQTLTGWRLAQQQVYEMIGSAKKELGPMRHAFIVPNPLLPAEYFNQRGLDEETIALNKDVPYSLLECPGKYTVQVATFKGSTVIRQADIRDIEEGRKEMGSQLAVAAQQADALVKELRRLGYDAYQYHDRYSSIVTVGNFKSPGTTLANGQIDFDPTIKKIIEIFSARPPDPNDPTQIQRQNASRVLSSQGMSTQALAPRRSTSARSTSPFGSSSTLSRLSCRSPSGRSACRAAAWNSGKSAVGSGQWGGGEAANVGDPGMAGTSRRWYHPTSLRLAAASTRRSGATFSRRGRRG